MLLPLLVQRRLGLGAAGFGLIMASAGAGALVGRDPAGPAGRAAFRIASVYALWGAGSLAIVGLGVAPTIPVAMFFGALTGFCFTGGISIWRTTVQEWVPGHILGRVFSVDQVASYGFQPASFALAGPVGAALGAAPAIVLGGLLGFGVIVLAALIPGVLVANRSGASSERPEGRSE